MTRHKASHEPQDEVSAGPVSSRACKQCALDRVRCSRSLPCKRCSNRQLTCCYPAGGHVTRSGNDEPASSQTLEPLSTSVVPSTVTMAACNATDPSGIDAVYTGCRTTPPVASNPLVPASSTHQSTSTDMSSFWNNSFDDFSNMCDIAIPGLGPLSINWISPGYQYDATWDLIPGTNVETTHANDFDGQGPQRDFGLADFDHHPQRPQAQAITPASVTTQSCGSTHNATTPESTRREYYVDGDGPRAPFGGRYHSRGSVPNIRSSLGTVAEPPPFGAQSSSLAGLCSLEAYENLVQRCMQEAQSMKSAPNMGQFPSHEQIELCTKHYFDNFSTIFPFLRQASFREVDSREWLLLLAVTAMGSRYMRPPQDLDKQLSNILRTVLERYKDCHNYSNLSASDEDLYVPGLQTASQAAVSMPVLQAGILHLVCLLQSGDKKSFDEALNWRYYLVRMCDTLRLLHSNTGYDGSPLEVSNEIGLKEWLCRESRIRTGMTIWVFPTFSSNLVIVS